MSEGKSKTNIDKLPLKSKTNIDKLPLKKSKTNIDKLPLKKVALGFLGVIVGMAFLYYVYSGTTNSFRSFHFENMGSLFDVDNYKFWKTLYSDSAKFNSGFGLKGKDYIDFKIDIRSEDASDDCRIKGKYRADRLTKMSIEGSGPNCSELRGNNKL
jgi:hypothetical protein